MRLLDEPDFAQSLALEEQCALADQFLAIFVFEAEWQNKPTLLLRAISTTVLGIQRYTTKRLARQGVRTISASERDQIPLDVLRDHFRAQDRLKSANGPQIHWTEQFANGAGDLSDRTRFVIADPDVSRLNALFDLKGEQERQ